MLRKIRIALALVFFLAVTALFLDFTGTIHAWLGWTAKIQFLPAVLALNIGIIVGLVVLTLLVGRVYCSVICPLGVFQDIMSWLSGRRRGKKFRFGYSPEKKWLRYGVLVLFVAAIIAGIGSIVTLLAPYSAFGRIVSNIFAPVYQWGNNLLAYLAERMDSYAFYDTDVWLKSLPTFIIAAVTLVVIIVLAWRGGRTYCNTICPVGTILSFFSRFALLRPTIDADKCKSCGLCSKRCKASCIDITRKRIDYSRCVACMDCISTCRQDALHLRTCHKSSAASDTVSEDGRSVEPAQVDDARRMFLTATAAVATAAAISAQKKKVDGGLAVIEDKEIPHRDTPLTPAGSLSASNMAQHCTACQLCVSVCPNGVLRPSSGIATLMQPEMSYERGYCRPECTRCSQVCPAGAIRPITPAEKSSIQIGHAVWIRKNCVPLTDGVSCGNCARHCPSGAIQMVPSDKSDPDSPQIPAINTAKCIGCGACENLCPARPFSAIYVEGNETHHVI